MVPHNGPSHSPGKFQAYVEVELKQLKEHLAILTGSGLRSLKGG